MERVPARRTGNAGVERRNVGVAVPIRRPTLPSPAPRSNPANQMYK